MKLSRESADPAFAVSYGGASRVTNAKKNKKLDRLVRRSPIGRSIEKTIICLYFSSPVTWLQEKRKPILGVERVLSRK